MRSEKQREASRINGSKSRGPTSPEGKGVSKFNGLKHGLRAEHVVLPGEDPAEFEAERRGWIDDWRPRSHTRAVLVERAAVGSWRLRRAVRAESALLADRAGAAGRAFDDDRLARVDRALDRVEDDPLGAMTLLELNASGLDRLIRSCGDLAQALEAGPAGWNLPVFHARLMLLLGRRPDDDPSFAGDVPKASSRLLAANDAEYAARPGLGHCVVVHPLPKADHEAAAELLRRAVAEQLDRLRGRRRLMPDPDEQRRQAVAAAYADGSEEGKLRHRYEMALDRSLRATIGQLILLERSGADLGGDPEPEPPAAPATPDAPAGLDAEVVTETNTDKRPASQAGPAPGPAPRPAEAAAPGSLGAPGAREVARPAAAPIGRRNRRRRRAAGGGGGGSAR